MKRTGGGGRRDGKTWRGGREKIVCEFIPSVFCLFLLRLPISRFDNTTRQLRAISANENVVRDLVTRQERQSVLRERAGSASVAWLLCDCELIP